MCTKVIYGYIIVPKLVFFDPISRCQMCLIRGVFAVSPATHTHTLQITLHSFLCDWTSISLIQDDHLNSSKAESRMLQINQKSMDHPRFTAATLFCPSQNCCWVFAVFLVHYEDETEMKNRNIDRGRGENTQSAALRVLYSTWGRSQRIVWWLSVSQIVVQEGRKEGLLALSQQAFLTATWDKLAFTPGRLGVIECSDLHQQREWTLN